MASSGPLTWSNTKNKFLPKKFVVLNKRKTIFQQKRFSRMFERTNYLDLRTKKIFHAQRKYFLYFLEKKFSKQK